jgi:hypothetical protein
MNLLGALVPLASLASLHEVVEDGSTNGPRTVLGAIGVVVIIAIVLAIGHFMTGSDRSAR